jgi:hypothetical protein
MRQANHSTWMSTFCLSAEPARIMCCGPRFVLLRNLNPARNEKSCWDIQNWRILLFCHCRIGSISLFSLEFSTPKLAYLGRERKRFALRLPIRRRDGLFWGINGRTADDPGC